MSNTLPLAVAILAAGQGKRMGNPDLAKVLTPLNAKPLLGYVLQSTQALDPQSVVVIVGHQRETVSEYVVSTLPSARCAVQEEQLGTGHAVMQTEQYLGDFEGNVLILSGDVPLLSENTLKAFLDAHQSHEADLTVLTTKVPDPTGYGRVIADDEGRLERIVEHKDASDDELAVNEINSGVYVVDAKELFRSLELVQNANAQAEYYLTDIAGILSGEGKNVRVFQTANWREVQGINTPKDLEQAAETLSEKENA